MKFRPLRSIISLACSVSLTLAPLPVWAQTQTLANPDHAAAKATLGGVFWEIAEMRAGLADVDFDPDAMAYALGDDPEAIFAFMRREIAYQPYPGLLRFGAGTLMNLAGNTCDQAALLGEMLQAAGRDVRYATAPMTPALQARLDVSAHRPATAFTAPMPFRFPEAVDRRHMKWLGYSDGMIQEQVGGAVLNAYGFAQEMAEAYGIVETLIGETLDRETAAARPAANASQTTHCWVMHRVGADWRDLDPAAWWLPAGDRALAPERVTDGLSLALAPVLKLSLDMDRAGKPPMRLLEAASTLFRPVNEVSMVFVPNLREGGPPPEDGVGEVFSLEVAVNRRQTRSIPFDLAGNAPPPATTATGEALGGAADVLNNLFGGADEAPPPKKPPGGGLFGGGLFGGGKPKPPPGPAPEKAPAAAGIERLTLTVSITNVKGESVTETRVLLDRPETLTGEDLTRDLQRQLSQAYEAVLWGGRIERAYLTARNLDALLDAQPTFEIMLDAQYGVAPPEPLGKLLGRLDRPNAGLLETARLRGAYVEHLAASDPAGAVYIGFPQMLAARTGFLPSEIGGPSRTLQVHDIVSNRLVVAGAAAARRHAAYGVTDTLVEYLAIGGGDAENFYRVLIAATDEAVAMTTLKGLDDPRLSGLDLPPETMAQLKADLARGYLAIAPARPVDLAGRAVFNWLRVDPQTGEALGRSALGGNTAEEATLLQQAIAQQKAALPYTLALCLVFTQFSHEIGSAISYLAGNPSAPAKPRSFRQYAVEYAACIVLSHVAMAGVQGVQAAAAARAAAAGAAGLGGAAAAGGGRPPPAAARPRAAPGGAGPVAGARPSGRHAGAHPNAAAEAGHGSSSQRPVVAGGRQQRPASFDSHGATIVDKPPPNVAPGEGTFVDGASTPPPRPRPNSPRTAAEQFRHIAENLFGPGSAFGMPVAQGRWNAMTPSQRAAAARTYRALRRADPAGNPRHQFERAIAEGAIPDSVPHAERVADGALNTTLTEPPRGTNPGVNLRQLADAAGVSPQQMRQILESRVADYPSGRRVEVGADGQVRLQPREPLWENLSSHERQLAEMSPQQDRRHAANDARGRAARDVERGLSVEESVAGQAHHNEIIPYEYMNRSGHTRAEGERHLSRYLESQGLTPEQARGEARRYFDGGDAGGAAGLPATPPDGPRSPSDGSSPGGGGSAAPREPGVQSPFEPANAAPNERPVQPSEQARRAAREAEGIAVEPDQLARMAEANETILMTPEELRAVAARHETIRMTPEQLRSVGERAETVRLTPEQARRMAEAGETVRMTPEQLRGVAERSETVRLTPEQQARLGRAGAPDPAQTRTRPATPVERRNPNLPPEAEFQTREAALRARDPEGLLPGERDRMASLDRRIRENRNELVPENQEIAQLAERTLMQHERSAIASRGERFQRRLDLRGRQAAAPEHPVPPDGPVANRPQGHVNGGRAPRRQMVQGDSDYLAGIMSDTRFQPSQNHVYAETVNANVRTILTENRFPAGYDGGAQQIHLLEVAPNRFVVQNGHHRLVSSEIASRLSGRPLLPRDVVPGSGLEPIIPADRLVITQAGERPNPTARDTRSWRQLGVQ